MLIDKDGQLGFHLMPKKSPVRSEHPQMMSTSHKPSTVTRTQSGTRGRPRRDITGQSSRGREERGERKMGFPREVLSPPPLPPLLSLSAPPPSLVCSLIKHLSSVYQAFSLVSRNVCVLGRQPVPRSAHSLLPRSALTHPAQFPRGSSPTGPRGWPSPVASVGEQKLAL